MKKISTIISQIIDLASDKLNIDYDTQYISVGLYDCGGTWQAWITHDYSGEGLRKYKGVYIDDSSYVEGNTIIDALQCLKDAIKVSKTIEIRN
jgi:hypothetical protein